MTRALPETERRSAGVMTMLTPDEKLRLELLAVDRDMAISTLVRELVLAAIADVKKPRKRKVAAAVKAVPKKPPAAKKVVAKGRTRKLAA